MGFDMGSNDYLKEIQEINFGILCEVDRVCRENGIEYSLCGLIGRRFSFLLHFPSRQVSD